MLGQTDGRTNRRTDTVPFCRPYCVYYAGSADNSVRRAAAQQLITFRGMLALHWNTLEKFTQQSICWAIVWGSSKNAG